MKNKLLSKVFMYVMYYLLMITIQYFAGFETTVLWACAYILVDINNRISNMEMISHLFGACGENPSLIYMIDLDNYL
jgi:hypothetical protein